MPTRRIRIPPVVRRWWPLVVLVTGLGGLVGYAYASSVTPAYEAETRLLVDSRGERSGGPSAASTLVPTYAELVGTAPVLEPAIERVGLALSPAELARDVRGEAAVETNLLTIRVRNRDPSVAVALANAVAVELRRLVHTEVARRRAGARAAGRPALDVRLRIVERDSRPTRIHPRTGLAMEFGALAALFSALAVATVVELRGRRIRDEHDLERAGVPVLGSVDGGALARKGLALTELGPPSPEVGAYDLLAARISSGNGRAPRSLLVLGTQAGDRSPQVALNLAAALAEAGARVAVSDLSRRRAVMRLAVRSGLRPPHRQQIGSVRDGKAVLDRFRLGPRRQLVVAVPRSSDPGRTSRQQAEALVGLLLAEADFVLVYAASLRRSPDTLAWARAVDATVVVARRERTRQVSVVSALESLGHVRTNVIGTVLHTR